MSTRTVDKLVAGWIDTSIGTLVRHEPAFLSRFAYWMITSIDSDIALADNRTPGRIVERHVGCAFLGASVLIPRDLGPRVPTEFNLFTGFDEVYLFDARPVTPLPAGVGIVAPADLSVDALSPGLQSWMLESACALGLGDGIGMNLVTPHGSLATQLEALAAAHS